MHDDDDAWARLSRDMVDVHTIVAMSTQRYDTTYLVPLRNTTLDQRGRLSLSMKANAFRHSFFTILLFVVLTTSTFFSTLSPARA